MKHIWFAILSSQLWQFSALKAVAGRSCVHFAANFLSWIICLEHYIMLYHISTYYSVYMFSIFAARNSGASGRRYVNCWENYGSENGEKTEAQTWAWGKVIIIKAHQISTNKKCTEKLLAWGRFLRNLVVSRKILVQCDIFCDLIIVHNLLRVLHWSIISKTRTIHGDFLGKH